jgi:hypothetical protein
MPTTKSGQSSGEQELLPCPFCGAAAEAVDPGYERSKVRCSNPDKEWCVGAEVSATPFQWNTRCQPAPADVKRLARDIITWLRFVPDVSIPDCCEQHAIDNILEALTKKEE